jgi:hypothetical protein
MAIRLCIVEDIKNARMNELESSNAESMLFELFQRYKEQPDTQQVYSTTIAA